MYGTVRASQSAAGGVGSFLFLFFMELTRQFSHQLSKLEPRTGTAGPAKNELKIMRRINKAQLIWGEGGKGSTDLPFLKAVGETLGSQTRSPMFLPGREVLVLGMPRVAHCDAPL